MQLHIGRNGESMGVFSTAEVLEKLGSGELDESDLGWFEGASNWMPLREVPALQTAFIPPPGPPPLASVSPYHHVSLFKFIVLSLCTFGLYELYWFYRNWRYVRSRDESRILPFWRTVFSVIWAFSLSHDLKRNAHGKTVFGLTLAPVFYLLLNACWRLPEPYDWLSLFAFVPLVPLVIQIHRINSELGTRGGNYSRFGAGSIIACLIGAPLFALAVLVSSPLVVPESVVEGDRLRGRDIAFLERTGMLEPGEAPLYFYSIGFFSIEGEGNLLTDRRVVSYYEDPYSGELFIDTASFDEIEDIEVIYSDNEFEDSVIVVVLSETDDDDMFWLNASVTDDGDERFADRLLELWNAARARTTIEDGPPVASLNY